jgi:hypothetical protein
MKTQRKTFVIILILLFSSISLGVFSFAILSAADTGLPDLEPMRLEPGFKDLPVFGARPSGVSTAGLHSSWAPGEYYEVGDVETWLSLDDYYGYYYWTAFELRAMNDLAEVWVQLNLSYGWDIFGGVFPDPRPDPVVSQEDIDYLLDEFTNNIYPQTTTYFGTPDYHDGNNGYWPDYYNGSSREVILVHNFKDYAYYDPGYPYYIAGFYSPSFEIYFDRNIINIDSHDWENRIGPGVPRPYLYESIIAHEYQHLIHADYNPDDPSWMNEACSLIAEPLCGYPIDYGQVQRFLSTPDNSLTAWGDQGDINILADYGSSFLWASYLLDHYGGADFFSYFVQNGEPGIDGIEATLDHLGYKEDFIDIYRDWRIANLIQADHGKYGYKTLDLDPATNPELVDGLTVHEVSGEVIPWTSGAAAFGNTFSWDGDDTGISEIAGFGTEYIHFPDLSGLNFIFFDGDDTSLVPGWELIDGEWYSGARDLTNALIFGSAHVDGADPTLTMTTYWDIEDYWDFGFVQISTDNGETWTSLENEYTIWDYDPNAHPDVIANLPGLTGWSEDYIEISFDLSAYADQDVLIGLRYVTDWATVYDGWFVEDTVTVSGAHVEFEPFFPEADFMVSIVEKTTYWGGKVKYRVRYMHLWDAYEYGATVAFGSSRTEVWLVVSPIMNLDL